MSKKTKLKSIEHQEPIWTLSNGLSGFRLLLVIPVVLLVSEPYTHRMALLGIALIAYLSDLGDGYIARKFNTESSFGRIIDPLADKIFVGGSVIGLLAAGLLPLWFVLVVLVRDVLIFSAGMFLRMRTGILIQSNMMGKVAVVSVGVVMVMSLFKDSLTTVSFSMFLVVSLGILVTSVVIYGERFSKLLKTGSR